MRYHWHGGVKSLGRGLTPDIRFWLEYSDISGELMHWIPSLSGRQSWRAIAMLTVFCLGLTTNANAQNTNQGGDANANGGQAGIGQGGLTPDQVFSQGVERTGVVGESTAPAVGASASSAAGQQSGSGTGGRAGGLGGFGGGGGLGAAFGNLFGGGNTGGNNSTPPIRTRMRAAVDLPPITQFDQIDLSIAATNRLRNASQLQPTSTTFSSYPIQGRYERVNVQVQNRTAVLTGEVATEADRRMSHLMMRLEPGVSNVQNRIRLAP